MRILLVEDEPAVQEVMVTMLERAGHLVVAETNGNKAFRRYRKEGSFDLCAD
jgi:CheY-like chemotaxis protein